MDSLWLFNDNETLKKIPWVIGVTVDKVDSSQELCLGWTASLQKSGGEPWCSSGRWFWSSVFWWFITLYSPASSIAGMAEVHTHLYVRQNPVLDRSSFLSDLSSGTGPHGRRFPFPHSKTVMISGRGAEQAACKDSLKQPLQDFPQMIYYRFPTIPKHTLLRTSPSLPALVWREGFFTHSVWSSQVIPE